MRIYVRLYLRLAPCCCLTTHTHQQHDWNPAHFRLLFLLQRDWCGMWKQRPVRPVHQTTREYEHLNTLIITIKHWQTHTPVQNPYNNEYHTTACVLTQKWDTKQTNKQWLWTTSHNILFKNNYNLIKTSAHQSLQSLSC